MSLALLEKGIDDQFVPEVRAKIAAEREKSMEALTKKTAAPESDPAAFHRGIQNWRSEDADDLAVSSVRYFGELARSEGVYPTASEKAFWETYWLKKLKVNQRFEEPRREFRVREFANDWWSLMKLFEAQKAPAWPEHPNATVQKAFTTNALQSVFPLFFDTNIVAGILANPVLERLVMTSIPVNSHTATHLKMTETDADTTMSEGGEGTTFVQMVIKEAERTVKLKKFGGELMWTYEVMRLQRLNVLALSIQRIGQRYNQLQTDYALSVLIDGDGAGDGAITDSAATTTGTPVYGDLVNAEFVFPQGYEPDTIVAPKEVIKKLYTMAEYKDPLAGILHQTTGNTVNPLGMDLVRWDSTGRVSTYAATNAVMLDSDLALVQYTEGGIITETERIIRAQWERAVTTQWVGYAVWDRSAAIRLTGW